MDECRALRAWAETLPVAPPAIETDRFAARIKHMHATLPSRHVDTMTGAQRAAMYYAILGHRSDDAIRFMVRRACETLAWFPPPVQCLEILSEYCEPATRRDIAFSLCRDFVQERFEQWMAALRDGTADSIGDVPEKWRRIAAERGYLRLMPDRTYAIRGRKALPPPTKEEGK
jgi:hypothetical protein